MTDNNWKFSSYFKLYGKEGLQVNFTVNGDDGATHIAEFGEYLTRLLGEEGFAITPEGIKPGEKLQEVDGWVLGETSEGQPCIHLYKTPLQWKVATIYEERIKDVPIKQDNKTFQWPGAAPEREAAERRGALYPCNFTIVLVPTGKTSDKGNPIFKFDRTIGFGSSSANGAKQKSTKKAADVQSYADLYDLLQGDNKKLADWCREAQGNPKNAGFADEDKMGVLCEEIDNVTGEEASAEAVLEVLTGIASTDLRGSLKSYVANGIIKWISPYLQNGKNTVENKDRRPGVVEAIKYIWGIASGYNEVNQRAAEGESGPSWANPEKSAAHKASGDVDFSKSAATDEDIPF